MFSKELPVIVFIRFTVLSIFIDIKFFLKKNREKVYNGFEQYSGRYADMVVLSIIGLVGYSFLGNNIHNTVALWLTNFILAVVYVAVFKTFLQLFVAWRYSWVDTNRERAEMMVVIGNRFILFGMYTLLALFYRHFALHLYQGISGNLISVILSVILARCISHKCHSINVKLKKEEAEDFRS